MLKRFLSFLLLFGLYSIEAQPSISKVDALLKDVFSLKNSANLEMNFSSSELLPSYNALLVNPLLDPDYLPNLYAELSENPNSPILWNDLANYHKLKSDPDKAFENYSKALSVMSIDFFKGDSARFLSFRGLLKFNVSDSTSIQDIKAALEINPDDSVAVVFYPTFLLARQEYQEAQLVLERALSTHSDYSPFIYYQLGITNVFSAMNIVLQSDSMSGEQIDLLFKRAYLDSVLLAFPEYKEEFETSRSVFELFFLMIKAIPEIRTGFSLNFQYNSEDVDRIDDLKEKFAHYRDRKSITPYLYNKAMGFLFLFENKLEESIVHLEKARDQFPLEKANGLFNSWDVYNTLILLSVFKGEDSKTVLYIERAIKDRSLAFRDVSLYLMKAKSFFESDQLDKAEVSCKAIHQEWPKNLDNLLLYGVIKNKKGFSSMARFYFQDAEKSLGSYEDQYKLVTVVACIQYLKGNIADFETNVELAEQVYIDQGFRTPLEDSWHYKLKEIRDQKE